MSLLESYLTNGEGDTTLHSLNTSLTEHMRVIKQEAESLSHRYLMDEAFQYQIASLCLCVETLREQIIDAEHGIERFAQNTHKKWRSYTELQQEMLRLLTAKTIETMTRMHRVDRSSSFNVIRVHAHHIDIAYVNKALVLPSPVEKKKELVVVEGGETVLPPVHEIFQSVSSRKLVAERATDLVMRFAEIQVKIRVYQAHYDRLGKLALLRMEHEALKQKMETVVCYVEQSTLMLQEDDDECMVREHIKGVNECFDAMREILRKECENCRGYMLNTVTRFIECSSTYQKLLSYLSLHDIELECLAVDAQPVLVSVDGCSSTMYQVSDDTMS